MSIYTKTGDKGETGLFSPDESEKIRVSKSFAIIEAIGSVDELNSFLGIIGAEINSKDSLYHRNVTMVQIEKKIVEIQANLFVINSILAGSSLKFNKTKTKKLEKEIDIWEKKISPQKSFIYYGGNKISALLFYARALCRRAERCVVALPKIQHTNPDILIYLNRLSDYVYTLARYSNFKGKKKEEIWEG